MAEIRRSPVEVTVACLIIFSVLHIAGGSLGFLPVGWPVLHPVFAASFSSWIHLFFRTDTFSEGVVGCCDESSLISSFRGKTDSSIKRYMEERLNRKDGILKVKKSKPFYIVHRVSTCSESKKTPNTLGTTFREEETATSWNKQDDLRNRCFWVTVCSAFQTVMKTPTPIQKKTSTARE